MEEGFIRVAAGCPRVEVASPGDNIQHITTVINKAMIEGADILVTPEMSITAYTCGDLFHNRSLLTAANEALATLLAGWNPAAPLTFVGMPVERDGCLYNCAIAIDAGKVVAVIPKTFLPSYNEFYEKRWFAPAPVATGLTVDIAGEEVPFGTDIILYKSGVKVGVELCEDLWAPVPPSCHAALAGAQVIVNLSASDDIVGKRAYLESLLRQQSARCICGYIYASAGYGESSTDLTFLGKAYVCENGKLTGGLTQPDDILLYDIDTMAIDRDRMHLRTFGDCASRLGGQAMRIIPCSPGSNVASGLLRNVDPHPFVPNDPAHLAERCEDILAIQSAGLRKRLDVTRCKHLVVGISGGLDSTLALLVAVRAFDEAGLDRSGIVGVTMPGFGTTDRTHDNAVTLMQALGITIREVSIAAAVNQHFSDIGHDPTVHDVTYENSQARERTQILMDIANQCGGMVLGTGDLSELALGWATYNGDHMSMYGVNAGVPKTLVKHLVRYYAGTADNIVATTLHDIIDTPISPELIPADEQGNITQKTEDLVGPYELHDFYLYYMLRHGYGPRRIYTLARKAFAGAYDDATILKWLRVFFRRFFNQQFKRSCLPDGPKVGSVTLSPRGDWRMPSDACATLWLKECDDLK